MFYLCKQTIDRYLAEGLKTIRDYSDRQMFRLLGGGKNALVSRQALPGFCKNSVFKADVFRLTGSPLFRMFSSSYPFRKASRVLGNINLESEFLGYLNFCSLCTIIYYSN